MQQFFQSQESQVNKSVNFARASFNGIIFRQFHLIYYEPTMALEFTHFLCFSYDGRENITIKTECALILPHVLSNRKVYEQDLRKR